jgi:hypothetical protein
MTSETSQLSHTPACNSGKFFSKALVTDAFKVETGAVAPIWVSVVFADEDVAGAVAVDVEAASEVPGLVAALASVEADADVTLLPIVEVTVNVCVRREEVLVKVGDNSDFAVAAVVAVLLKTLMLVKLKVKGLVEMDSTVVEVMVVVCGEVAVDVAVVVGDVVVMVRVKVLEVINFVIVVIGVFVVVVVAVPVVVVVTVVLIATCVVFVLALVVVKVAVACGANVTVLVDMLVILVDDNSV